MGGEAGDFAALLVEGVDGAEGVGDDLADAGEAALDAFFGDLHELLLGGVEDVEGVFALVGGAGHGGLADGHDLAEEALVLDDADVLFDVEAMRKIFGEREEVGPVADGLELFTLVELFDDGDEIDGAADVNQAGDAGVDAAVGVEREVVGDELGGGVVEGDRVEHHGAEDGALGLDGSGETAVGEDVCEGCHEVLGYLFMKTIVHCKQCTGVALYLWRYRYLVDIAENCKLAVSTHSAA